MKNLCSLSNEAFGSIDALQDELLLSCFQEHEAYNALINYSKFLAIGKKGAGKTAIFQMIIKQSDPEIFAEGHNLSDYPWHHHALQAKNGVPENEKYIQSWMYLILIAIAKILINKDQSIPFDSKSTAQLKLLKSFVSDTYGTTNPEITALFSPQRKIKLSALKARIGQIGIDLPAEVIDMSSLPICIQDINKALLDAILKCVHPEHRYYICFDELDIGFEPQDSYYNQIIGLLRAARKFNITAQEQSKNIGVCVFLRDDIYDVLRFEDKRKLTADCVTRIEWDSERTHYTLKDLMNKRFTVALSENGEDVFWEDVFDSKLINGKNSKYNYIIDLTCLRPRDIIDYCNLVLDYFKTHFTETKCNKFQNEDIIGAKPRYSGNLLEEFDDEVHKHMPDYELYLRVIKSLGKSRFSTAEFVEQFNKIIENGNPEKCLEELYGFSMIGNFVVGGNAGGSHKIFKYKNSRNEFNADEPIIVHPGLVSALGIKEKKVKRVKGEFAFA